MKTIELTKAQKKFILHDFKLWSGGYTPDEVPYHRPYGDYECPALSVYLRACLPLDGIPKAATVRFLKTLAGDDK